MVSITLWYGGGKCICLFLDSSSAVQTARIQGRNNKKKSIISSSLFSSVNMANAFSASILTAGAMNFTN